MKLTEDYYNVKHFFLIPVALWANFLNFVDCVHHGSLDQWWCHNDDKNQCICWTMVLSVCHQLEAAAHGAHESVQLTTWFVIPEIIARAALLSFCNLL